MSDFFTAKGDSGTTGLLGEERVKKFDPRMEALGTLDELSASLGLARSICCTPNAIVLKSIQVHLYEIMGEVAATIENQAQFRKISGSEVLDLEKKIEEFSKDINIPKGFILPGDTQASAFISLARTIARRAERRIAELLDHHVIENTQLLRYLNRLSSFLFVLELKEIADDKNVSLSLAKDGD